VRDETPAPAQSPPAPHPSVAPSAPAPEVPAGNAATDARELQKRIVQYNTLFSINADFYRLRERKALLDALLLTTIAQVGVESAVFLEHTHNYFVPVAMKGIEPGEMRGFALSGAQLHLDRWGSTVEVQAVEKSPFGDDVKAPLLAVGCTYVAPFIVRGDVRGILLLGRPIRSELDHGAIEFLKILIHQAAVAYESMARFEEENERTLGVVQTLMSLIEENTLARGNTNLVSNYVYTIAQRMHYPAEHLRDLMYGTVLRDIGMIKVSDLIVRSPRELMPEEWEIIKRHPSDGAVMLRDMKFSEHATNIVLHHHERFNGAARRARTFRSAHASFRWWRATRPCCRNAPRARRWAAKRRSPRSRKTGACATTPRSCAASWKWSKRKFDRETTPKKRNLRSSACNGENT
jgi:HD-GYP domain-containing protein (c-di-GMP phosphodiesterase class II)